MSSRRGKATAGDQVVGAVGDVARVNFGHLYKWLTEKCSNTFTDPSLTEENFFAVLDIARFEILGYNGVELISIHFVNEKQQSKVVKNAPFVIYHYESSPTM